MPKARPQPESAKAPKSDDKMQELATLGQSIWLDSIDRRLIDSGALRSLVERGLRGLTSNPAIFEKAIGETSDYDSRIAALLSRHDLEVKELFDELSVSDIREAADILLPVYRRSTGIKDGLVSLELAPFLAHDSEGSIAEARRLWKKVDRPNLMIKVPGTPEGLDAFSALITEGINVNVTLLFSRTVYRAFAERYLTALETRLDRGLPVGALSSVASFFVSRIDTAVDKLLVSPFQKALRGSVAIANAKCAYQIYLELFQGPRWERLSKAGAQAQRLLWASTSVKNPAYRDVLYLEELVGRDTVNTVPPATLRAFEDHGVVRPSLSESSEEAAETLQKLAKTGISLEKVTDELTREGIRLFAEPYRRLMATLEKKRRELLRSPLNSPLNSIELRLPILLEAETGIEIERWRDGERVRRLWKGDSSLWTSSGESSWLGWLGVIPRSNADLEAASGKYRAFAKDIRASAFEDVVVLGMGGSSLCADLISSLFDPVDHFPVLHVLDSTDPAQIRALESKLDLERTLFVVSSKSGSTLEPNLFLDYFYERLAAVLGPRAGSRFIAITDPGSALENQARARGFRHVFHGIPSIGGRYSALSDFGMIPAASMGLDVADFLSQASVMANSCSPNVPADENPGLLLGAALGRLGKAGHDKITLICSPEIWELGDWLEQLLAESTGKRGTGLIPVTGEKLGAPEVYGGDRLFVYFRLSGSIDRDMDPKISALEAAGFPVIRIEVCDCPALAQEFFRWEFATAIAGAILGINPFDQPDVESAKERTRLILESYEKTGSLPQPAPIVENGGIALFADPDYARALGETLKNGGEIPSPRAFLRAHLSRLRPGDYVALLAYLPALSELEMELDSLRLQLRDSHGVAVTVGLGPRYLHSTGQIHKGGPESGVFLEITAGNELELTIPGRKYGFGTVEQAQALGDFEALTARKRRVLRVHLHDRTELGRLRELL